MLAGQDPELDILTDIPLVPTSKLRHIDLSRCTRLTSVGVKTLAHLVPELEGLSLSGCTALTHSALADLFTEHPEP
jgi:F-box/leucine-rich repeat protein 2/20